MVAVGLPRNEQPDIKVSSEVKKMDEDKRLVPVAKLQGREFLVDIENREFVDTNDLNNCISMHSRKGRAMVSEMAGREWHCFSVYPGKQDGMAV